MRGLSHLMCDKDAECFGKAFLMYNLIEVGYLTYLAFSTQDYSLFSDVALRKTGELVFLFIFIIKTTIMH